jgi:hypothetical protein
MAEPLIAIKQPQIDALRDRFRAIGDEGPAAVVRAVNRTNAVVLGRVVETVAGATGMKDARVRKSIRARSATLADFKASVSLYGGRGRLIDYSPRIISEHIPRDGFTAKMPGSGHVGVFQRAPGARHRRKGEPFAPHQLPIREVMGPAFTEFIGGGAVREIMTFAQNRLRKEMENEVNFRMLKQATAPAK